MIRLVMFDVDGTLVQSMGVDTSCYSQAVSETLGTPISTNWAEYRESTDEGILNELFDRHGFPSERRAAARDAVRSRFIGLLTEALESDPACCREVTGAALLLRDLQHMQDVQIAIATGGWAATALLKLRHAGIAVDGVPFASSDDAGSREEILRIAHRRASRRFGRAFGAVTYVGDGTWDVRAAAALGFEFIGMACESGTDSLASAGAEIVLPHFAERETFFGHIASG